MGWLFTQGQTRKQLIESRAKDWEVTHTEGKYAGVTVTSKCIAHCYRGGRFFGVLWTVWEQNFTMEGQEYRPTERWIGCDLLQFQRNFGWGYKDMDESMHPYYYSCPLSYLEKVPVANEEWRKKVRERHAQRKAQRLAS